MTYSRIPKILLASAFVAVLSLVSTAYAAEISLTSDAQSFNIGDTFTVNVSLDTQGENINATEGKIVFPSGSLEVKNIDTKDTIVNVWAQEPAVATITKEATGEAYSEVFYSGGIAGGYKGKGKLFALVLTVKTSDKGTIKVANAKAFLNDGKATPAKLTSVDYDFGAGSLTYEEWQKLAEYLLKEIPDGVKNKIRSGSKCGFVTMNAAAGGWKVKKTKKTSDYFKDINQAGPKSSWCVPAADYAYEHKIVEGRSKGVFGLQGTISRYEVATIVARELTQANNEILDNTAVTPFVDDKNIPDWARGAASYLNKKGIFKGFDLKNGTFQFGGEKNIINIDAAIVLYRTFVFNLKK